ncbi:hypothetical protein WA026_021770 [Henosepilachna vigintioctopunctata]|uniref:Uncharacterized protein n=1 Tax=Henosepilachna vigintioctopunctata TaxID=420089 RepID=A0AAW1TP24_9CUCU
MTDTVTDFASMLTPGNYKYVKDSLNKVANFKSDKQVYLDPSTASELGTLLKEVTDFYNTYLIENQENIKKKLLRDFRALLEEDLSNRINRTVTENQSQLKHKRKIVLPSVSDIKKLVDYVDFNRKKNLQLFISSKTLQHYISLASYTLISILIFNRRRVGQMERLLISNRVVTELRLRFRYCGSSARNCTSASASVKYMRSYNGGVFTLIGTKTREQRPYMNQMCLIELAIMKLLALLLPKKPE